MANNVIYYKKYKVIKNGYRDFTVWTPNGEGCQSCKSMRSAKRIINVTLNNQPGY